MQYLAILSQSLCQLFILFVDILPSKYIFGTVYKNIVIFLTRFRIISHTSKYISSYKIRRFSILSLRLCKEYSKMQLLMTILHRKGL